MLIRHEHGFKIRNKDDAKKFLNYCVQGDGYSVHKINKTHCFFI